MESRLRTRLVRARLISRSKKIAGFERVLLGLAHCFQWEGSSRTSRSGSGSPRAGYMHKLSKKLRRFQTLVFFDVHTVQIVYSAGWLFHTQGSRRLSLCPVTGTQTIRFY